MKIQKNSLKDSFHQWISKVKKATKDIKSLEENLVFFNTKLTGYHSVSFDTVKVKESYHRDDLTYWIIKIDECERKIKICEALINELGSFLRLLSDREQTVFNLLFLKRHRVSYVAKTLNISKRRIYDIELSVLTKYRKYKIQIEKS